MAQSTLDKSIELAPCSHCDNLNEEHGLEKQASSYELGKMGLSPTEPLAAGSLATCSLLPCAHGQTGRRWDRQ